MNLLAALGLCMVVLSAVPSRSIAWPMAMPPPENQAYFKVEFFNGNAHPQMQPQTMNYPIMPYSSPFYANIPYPRYQPQPFYSAPIPVPPYSYNSNPFSSFFHNHQTPRFVVHPQPQAPRQNQPMKNMAAPSNQAPKNPGDSDNLYDIIQNRMLNKEEPKMTWHKILQMINERRGLNNPGIMDLHVVPLMAFNAPVNQLPATTRRINADVPPQPRVKTQRQGQAPPTPPAPPMPSQNKVEPQNAKEQEKPSKPDIMSFKNIKFDNPRAILENMGFRVFEIPFSFNNKQSPVKDDTKDKLQFRSAEIINNELINTNNEKNDNEEDNNKIKNIPNNEEDKLETRSIKMDSLNINTKIDENSEEDEEDSLKSKLIFNEEGNQNSLKNEGDEENSRILILPNQMAM